MESKYEGMKAKMAERLSCSICFLQFNSSNRTPKTFQCQHSICVSCIDELISKNYEHQHFPCPICREEVNMPKEGVEGFKTNSALVSMLELMEVNEDDANFAKHGDEVNTTYCNTHAGNYC